ncbi:MAG: hypothetical protein ACOYN0_12185 [Phycisphaerales bacterium]
MIRSSSAAALSFLIACSPAIAQSSIVTFAWGNSGSATAAASGNCEPGCDDTSGCTSNPVPSFSAGDNAMTPQNWQQQAGRNCTGVCGGLAIATGSGQANGSAQILSPSVNGEDVLWAFSYSTTVQTSAGAGSLCGVGSASGQGQSSHFYDLVFDTPPGLTLLTFAFQHDATSAPGGASATWSLTNGTSIQFSDSIAPGAQGTVSRTGSLVRVLSQGRYHFRLDASAQASSAAAVSGGQNLTAGAAGAMSLRLEPLRCIAVTTQPTDIAMCANSPATFSALATGTEPLEYQWQIQSPAGVGGGSNLANGALTIDGLPAGTVNGATSYQLTVLDFDCAHPVAVRCVFTNPCGPVPSNPATLAFCRADVDCSGGVDGDDVIMFFGAWDAGEPVATSTATPASTATT